MPVIEELHRQQMESVREKKAEQKKQWKKRFLPGVSGILFLLLAVVLLVNIGGNRRFEVTYYRLSSEKINTPVKFVVLSDLHSVEYGEDNRELIEAVRKEEPDFIAMIGDMLNQDDGDTVVIQNLCRELKETAPIYYTLGNHEGTLMYGRQDSVALDDILAKEDVRLLINQTTEFQKKDTVIKIVGISNEAKGYDYWAKEKLAGFWEQEGYKLVLSHFPDLYYEKLKEAELDLALAGHYHGGMIRIPGVGGLFHPEEGFFPEYSGGLYALTKGTLIVSRGIGGHGWIPRVNNRPELVVIELTQKQE